MKQFRYTAVTLALAVLLSFTAIPARAQDDAPPIDDEFVEALVMMSINHNMMQGRNEVRDLSALSQYVDEYYAGLASAAPDENARFSINLKRAALISKIQDRINISTGLQIMDTIIDIVSDDSSPADDARRIVGGEFVPLTGDYFSVVNSRVMTDFESQVSLLIDLSTAISTPSMAPAIADNSGWSYTPASSISSIASSLSPGNDSSNGSSPSDESTSPSSSSPSIGDSTAGAGDQTAYNCSDPRPLRFDNAGFEAATVRVETFQPASGCSTAAPSASTVVFPDSSSAAWLELPPGTYTFCYEWELGDVDYDGTTDYHHRATSSYTITSDSTTNPDSARVVTISPDSAVSNPNGRCSGEAPSGTGDTNTAGLTPEEAANAGTHTYLITCTGDSICEGESETQTFTLTFNGNSLRIKIHSDGEVQTFERLGPNRFLWINSMGDEFIFVFTSYGFTYSNDTVLGQLIYTRMDQE